MLTLLVVMHLFSSGGPSHHPGVQTRTQAWAKEWKESYYFTELDFK